MLDRASTFANEGLLELLRRDFVPVAIDQAYQRRQQDAEGAFYRKFAGQGPRRDFQATTQGFYVATAGGELLLYNNNRDPKKIERLVREALAKFRAGEAARAEVAGITAEQFDRRYHVSPPEGGLVLRVHAKVLGGYPAPKDDWQRMLQQSIGRDNLWVTAAEVKSLVAGELPDALLRRLARFHLVDNTRGEPPMWATDEVRELAVKRDGERVSGAVKLATKDGARSFTAQMLGFLAVADRKITRFDLVVAGTFTGEGPFTRHAPPGAFPFAVAFTLADGSDVADAVPPQGSRGWLEGYLR